MIIPLLIKHWRFIGSAVVLGAFALWVGHIKYKAELYDTAKIELETCQSTAVKTKEANDVLQKSRDVIANRLAAAKRVQSSCVHIKPNAQSSGAEHAGSNGISSEWLLEYAAQCETYRSERIVLEEFLAK
jgi:hypothetical protein